MLKINEESFHNRLARFKKGRHTKELKDTAWMYLENKNIRTNTLSTTY